MQSQQLGFVVIIYIHCTSVKAYMKFLDPTFSSLHSRFDGLKCRFNLGEPQGSSSGFCSAKTLGVNNEGKGSFVPEFLFWQANIP